MARWALGIVGAAIIGVALLLVFLFHRQDQAGRIAGNPAEFSQTTIRDPRTVLEEPNASNLLGRNVLFEDARVTRVTGDYVFWISADSGEIPVVLFGEVTSRQPETATEIRDGDRVRIYGQVRVTRDLRGINGMLSPAQRQELLGQPVYVSALRVVALGD